ncbi:MAG: hypothetical protein HY686_07905 [Chloroflexi bacterium]|nr:hypothetical protein [Chloroflexota bacterium]
MGRRSVVLIVAVSGVFGLGLLLGSLFLGGGASAALRASEGYAGVPAAQQAPDGQDWDEHHVQCQGMMDATMWEHHQQMHGNGQGMEPAQMMRSGQGMMGGMGAMGMGGGMMGNAGRMMGR